MAYIGYSKHTQLFTKLLVEEFGDNYEGDSYLIYFEKTRLYLEEDISEQDFVKFLDNTNFCIFELDHLLKNINDIIENSIPHKQKLNKFLNKYIDESSNENREVYIKALSLLFDDFLDLYNEDIFDYENFYISIFGIFINLSQEKFMEFIDQVIKYNSLTFDDFYFLINFLQDFVEFKYLDKYTKKFIIYCKDYLDVIDDSVEHISMLMFLTFKLNKTLTDISKGIDNNNWKENKELIISTLKLLSNYCEEYNLVFIDKINEDDNKFLENRDIVYAFLKYLTAFPINEGDCDVILEIYSKLIFDYKDYESIRKVTEIVKYLISPILKHEIRSGKILSKNTQEVINVLSCCFLLKINYVKLIKENYNIYGFNKEIVIYILKLIYSEEIENKQLYINDFIKYFRENIIDEFNYGDEGLFTYILWIINDIVKSGKINIYDVFELLCKNERICNEQIYILIKNILSSLNIDDLYSFEGKSFYLNIKDKKNYVFRERIDREYFYAKNLYFNKNNFKVINEKNDIISKLKNYFNKSTLKNRELYYSALINNKYFDVYKFDLIKELEYENICVNKLKKECDFLIYNSPNIEGFKLGLLFSCLFNENYYLEVYNNSLFKMDCGDIYSYINIKFGCFNEEDILRHESYNFLVKWIIFKNVINSSDRLLNKSFIKSILDNCFKQSNFNTDVYYYMYEIIFYDEGEELFKINDINTLTLKIRTILNLLEEDIHNDIIDDSYIYEMFNKYFDLYTKVFVSLTQFEVLNDVYNTLEGKFIKSNKDITYKEIEFNIIESGYEEESFKNSYIHVMKKINKVFKSDEAESYYENIFLSENINLIIEIISNEKVFYNDTMELFYKYINNMDVKHLILEKIYKKTIRNVFIARVFIKLLSYYPSILQETIKNIKTRGTYIKIIDNSI